MRSTNPILKEEVFKPYGESLEGPMTIYGTVNKMLILSIVLLIGATAVLYQYQMHRLDYVNILTFAGCIIGLILAFIITFAKRTAPILAPIYAFAEGACLSGISCYVESAFPGIVIQAVSITFITVFSMAILYQLRIIQATQRLRSTLLVATLAISIFYLISLIAMFMGIDIPYFTSTSTLSIFVNTLFAIVAAFYLILDFDFIERGAQMGAPKHLEWYGAFGLMVTIVWLYLEILRLLERLRSR